MAYNQRELRQCQDLSCACCRSARSGWNYQYYRSDEVATKEWFQVSAKEEKLEEGHANEKAILMTMAASSPNLDGKPSIAVCHGTSSEASSPKAKQLVE